MILQIQLAIPGSYILIGIIDGFMHAAEELIGTTGLYMRQSRDLIQHTAHFQHIVVHTAATVTMTIGQQGFVKQILILEFFPGTQSGNRSDLTIISRTTTVELIGAIRSLNEIGKDFRSIDTTPLKDIFRNGVILIPSDLGGHKGLDIG